jgi:hypothetical protein
LPIEVIYRIAGSNINDKFISSTKQGKPSHPKDKNFLIYDGDVSLIISRLKNISSAELIISNPSIELWFLYPYKNQKAEISSADCIRELSNRNRNRYRKGLIDNKLKEKLESQCGKACERAKSSGLFENPSSNVFILIEELERVKMDKKTLPQKPG